ncbi:uncharacterized protein LOC128546867 [Mercenaria mercenaria]|uniref:uncharacterized protein LOC128546867 n=1 Tax=Mercenaria mercenaria TaxID=6596 RepID=UPI00234F8759|nr:uncharacterized protein LOC128546867 [Mercenaria mercenaria]
MHSVPFKYMDSVDLKSEQCQKVFRGYFGHVTNNVTPEQCQLIETLTRGQNSSKWMDARKERITSSVFGQVIKRKDSTEPDNLLKSMLYTYFQNPNTKYGKTHEKPARKMYSKFMNSNGHKGLLVKECGFIVSKDSPFLGTSPDGLVYCTHCESQLGLVEIKCPAAMKWRMKSPNECASDKDFFCEISDGKVSLKKNHNYYFQVQGQMGITGRK